MQMQVPEEPRERQALVNNSEATIEFVNVIFRHGDRTPTDDPHELFPTSPYSASDFQPYGYGQLTNRGKQRAYDLGRHIRKQYGKLLGEIYNPNTILARSTALDRSKMSLELVMAGIFSPSAEEQWRPESNLQNVVSNYLPWNKDMLLLPVVSAKYKNELRAVENLPEVREEIEKFAGFQEDLSRWTGRTIESMQNCSSVYNGLAALQSMELELPKWADGIFPNGMLAETAGHHYRIQSYNKRLKALNGGMILRHFTENMLAVARQEAPSSQKMVLLSGHDTNIAGLLTILGAYESHVPDYCSTIFVELLSKNNKYYVNINYCSGTPLKQVPVRIHGCEELCDLETFTELFRDVLPTDQDLLI